MISIRSRAFLAVSLRLGELGLDLVIVHVAALPDWVSVACWAWRLRYAAGSRPSLVGHAAP